MISTLRPAELGVEETGLCRAVGKLWKTRSTACTRPDRAGADAAHQSAAPRTGGHRVAEEHVRPPEQAASAITPAADVRRTRSLPPVPPESASVRTPRVPMLEPRGSTARRADAHPDVAMTDGVTGPARRGDRRDLPRTLTPWHAALPAVPPAHAW